MSLRPTERTQLTAVIQEQRQEIARLRALLQQVIAVACRHDAERVPSSRSDRRATRRATPSR